MRTGEIIRKLRVARGLNKQELADKAMVTVDYISSIENDELDVRNVYWDTICKALEIDEIFVKFLAIDVDDIQEDKKEFFEKIKPLVDGLIKDVCEIKE